ncbi:right-handed parallel beta-helix repeat-containing protein [Paenibacillus sp. strain BS8-2]
MNYIVWSLIVVMQVTMLASSTLAGQDGKVNADIPKQPAAFAADAKPSSETLPVGANEVNYQENAHVIDLKRWGIANNGTKPVETTKGINRALAWAHKSGITAITLPPGIYMVDKNSHIEMVPHMLFELSDKVTIQKETNNKENYVLMKVGFGDDNVTIRGGIYKGDKDTHDYSKKESPHTPGTHESGYGISVVGARNLTIENVTSTHFTGDGLGIGAHGTLVRDLYENSFVSGGIDDKGKFIANANQIRTTKPLKFDHAIFKDRREFELANPIKLKRTFHIYFYTSKNVWISSIRNVNARDILQIPDGASYAHLVFDQPSFKDAYIEQWNRALSENIVVQDSEFAYNRRQGITIGGADGILIMNNELHHMKGTMPQSGIDVEGGFGENGNRNLNIIIKNNQFHNNASYDVILYDGKDAIIEGNHLASKGAIGLAVSPPFTGAIVRDNHFDGSRIIAYHDVTFLNNRLNNSFTTLEGPRIHIDGMEVTDGILSINAQTAYGVTAQNVTIKGESKKADAGLVLNGKKVNLSNITIIGESKLRTVSGAVEPGSMIEGLKVIGYNSTYGVSLPPATYKNCTFEGAEGATTGAIGMSIGGKYVFDGCSFKVSRTAMQGLIADHPKLDLTVRNSSFQSFGNGSPISVQAAANVLLENNKIIANQLTKEKVELIKLNDYWKRTEKHDILKAVIKGNTITSNLASVGISTVYSGVGAPAYSVTNNKLEGAVLALKDNDKTSDNEIIESD